MRWGGVGVGAACLGGSTVGVGARAGGTGVGGVASRAAGGAGAGGVSRCSAARGTCVGLSAVSSAGGRRPSGTGGAGGSATLGGSGGFGGSGGLAGSTVTSIAVSGNGSRGWCRPSHTSASTISACKTIASASANGDIRLDRRAKALTAWATAVPFYGEVGRSASARLAPAASSSTPDDGPNPAEKSGTFMAIVVARVAAV